MKIYIAASWKHQHAVEMLTEILRERGHEVLSFVENNHGEHEKKDANRTIPFDEWVWSEAGEQSFRYDTEGAKLSTVVIYLGPSGQDAAAEVGIAWCAGAWVLGLHAKGEGFGLMRRLVEWHFNYRQLLARVDELAESCKKALRPKRWVKGRAYKKA